MKCPYCRTPLAEHVPECPACRLEHRRVLDLLGPVPPVQGRLSDASGHFSPLQRWRLLKRLDQIERRFPQVRVQILCQPLPTEHPLPLYLFWIFNGGSFQPDLEKDGDRHAVLVTLDPKTSRAAIMVGYALEPFVSEEALDRCLEAAAHDFTRRRWAAGLRKILAALDASLAQGLESTLDAFDLAPAGPSSGAD